jgi:Flp pilus assembly protein TadG
MALELALLTPLLVAFMMLLAGLGRVVEAQSQVDGAARDAARAASIARTRPAAQAAADDAADGTLGGDGTGNNGRCEGGPRAAVVWGRTDWRPGGQVTTSVTCVIDLGGLSLIGFTPAKTMTGTATAPIDTLRRVG